MKKIIVVAAAAVVVLAGCSQTAPAATVDLPNEESATPVAPEQPETDWANVKTFLKAQDATGRPEFTGLVAPGSPAERWVEFATDSYNSETASGDAYAGLDETSYVIDEDTGVVTATTTYDDGSPDKVVKLTKWITDEEGRIVSYADENGIPLEERLWTQEPSGAAEGETVQVLSAFRSSAGYLFVNVAVTTDGEFTDFDASYVGPDGIARKALTSNAGEAVNGATNLVTYAFDQAPFGGKFIYNASGEWDSVPITLVIG